MFINFTNHPSSFWSKEQLNAAATYGNLVDIPFPVVDPSCGPEEIARLADDCVRNICEFCNPKNSVIHIMGEITLTFAIVVRLKPLGFRCLASTSKRISKEITPGRKCAYFKFVRFREY